MKIAVNSGRVASFHELGWLEIGIDRQIDSWWSRKDFSTGDDFLHRHLPKPKFSHWLVTRVVTWHWGIVREMGLPMYCSVFDRHHRRYEKKNLILYPQGEGLSLTHCTVFEATSIN